MTIISAGGMSILAAIDLYLRRWKRSYDSRRKVLILVFVIIVVLYLISSIFSWLLSSSPVVIDEQTMRAEQYLLPYLPEEKRFDSYIARSWPLLTEQQQHHEQNSFVHFNRQPVTAFIGNGKLGLRLDEDGSFYIRGGRGLGLALPFHPVIHLELMQYKKESATVVRFVEGKVDKITVFPYVRSMVTITESFYAHRIISSLLVQEIRIDNPSDVPLLMTLSRTGWKGRSSVKSQSMRMGSRNDVMMTEGEIHGLEGNLVHSFVVATPQVPDSVEIPAKQKKTILFRTFVNYTTPTSTARAPSALTDVKKTLIETIKKVNELSSTSLLNYHTEAWHDLWKSGFGISFSKAESVLNGDAINATIYFVLSQTSSFSSDLNLMSSSDREDVRTNFLLDHPDRCYAGNPTLQAPSLWSSLQTYDNMQKVVDRWLLTLDKNGCKNLMTAGAEGMMQAMILSFVGMQFHQNHLEIGIHPKELHRDYYLRRIRYSNSTDVNITVSVGDDYKASIYVLLLKNVDRSDFFACDAGCLDPPVTLSTTEWKQLPVKITEPLTPILYITSNLKHIKELKHAIHVQEVAVAPAHETELIALHRHGHRLGGLPALFWVAILFLIVIFHLFLAKLIYNEYCGGSSVSSLGYERLRRAV